jgi:hypothetical protein
MMSPTHRFIWTTLIGSFTLLIIWLPIPQISFAAVYKWKDDNGKLHFTDQPSKIPPKYRKKHGKPVYKSLPPNNQTPGTTRNSPIGGVPIESEEPGEFSVVNSYGQRTSITVDDNSALFAVATWCHYSKKFIRFLNDPRVASKMRHLDLIFVFEDEWPYMKKQFDKSVGKNGVTQRQVDEHFRRYKDKAGGKPLYNPDFTRNLPGKHYFATPAATKLGKIFPKFVPSAYSPSKEIFERSIARWIRTQFNDQTSTRDFLIAEFGKYNNGEK